MGIEPLTVIVITHNRLEYTKRTIDSLKRTIPNAKISIYDNCSTEEGMNEYLSTLTDCIVTINDKNEGWGKAVNDALRITPYDKYVLISNNDVGYYDGWYEKCLMAYEKYPNIGLLGVWKHSAHGIKENLGDLIIKDQMPAVGWLFTKEHLNKIGDFPEHGPCNTKGGNGEDVEYCIKTEQVGLLVCGLPEDIANHYDGE